ncbi:MAG TPA: lytic transglycosylase domain-containing protein [Longimicrobiales bacterium]|nr:lytic transglycosylase domain-containing protein [Longimicrobiales bacterium]
MRFSPKVRALCERARRPALRVVLGGALMVPSAVLMASGQLDSLAERERTIASRIEANETDPVTREWGQRTLERERELVVASFAAEFDIPIPLATDIHEAALAEKIVPRVAFGLVQAESSFRTRAVSPVGAVGLTQLLPSTARWLVPGTTRSDLMKPETNLRVGFQYLRYLMDKYEGDEKLALTAYNRGPGTVSKLLARGKNPDNGYADKVLTGKSALHVRLMNAKFGG